MTLDILCCRQRHGWRATVFGSSRASRVWNLKRSGLSYVGVGGAVVCWTEPHVGRLRRWRVWWCTCGCRGSIRMLWFGCCGACLRGCVASPWWARTITAWGVSGVSVRKRGPTATAAPMAQAVLPSSKVDPSGSWVYKSGLSKENTFWKFSGHVRRP